MKKLLSLLLVAVLVFSFAACGSGSTDGGSAAPSGGSEAPSGGSDGPIEIDYWHCMSGELERAVMAQVDAFNASQNEVHVNASYQGNFDDTNAKYQSALVAGDAPVLGMVERMNCASYWDAGQVHKLNDFIERDNFDIDAIKQYMSYSTFNGDIVGVPVNRSVFCVYYNMDAAEAAGLDTNDPPSNWEEFYEWIDALTVKENGEVKVYGYEPPVYNLNPYSGYIQQCGGSFYNEDFTDIGFNNEAGRLVYGFYEHLRDCEGVKFPPKTDSFETCKSDFYAGNANMIFESCAAMVAILENTEGAGSFRCGAFPFPAYHDNPVYTTGGSNICMFEGHTDEEYEAAWKFIQYLYEPESCGGFAAATGYLPLTKAAYDSKVYSEALAKWPQLSVPFNASVYVNDTPPCTVHNEITKVINTYNDQFLLEGNITIDEVLNGISKEAQVILKDYTPIG